ncbi:hypothetical protein D3C80_1358440 [compost metagenome]
MHRIHCTAGGRRGDHRVQTAGKNAETALFAFHIDVAVDTELHKVRVAMPFSPHHQRGADHKNQRHRPEQRAPLAAVVHHIAKGKAECGGDQEDRQHLHKVSQRGGVFERVRRVGIEESAAVCAEHFDGFLRGHRPHRQHLFYPFK